MSDVVLIGLASFLSLLALLLIIPVYLAMFDHYRNSIRDKKLHNILEKVTLKYQKERRKKLKVKDSGKKTKTNE